MAEQVPKLLFQAARPWASKCLHRARSDPRGRSTTRPARCCSGCHHPKTLGTSQGNGADPRLREPRHRGCRARRRTGGWNISCCRCNAAWLENWLSCGMTTEKSFLKASFSKCARILLVLAQEPAPAAQASSSSKPHVPGGTSICKTSPVIAE